jgi:hypothetical protein
VIKVQGVVGTGADAVAVSLVLLMFEHMAEHYMGSALHELSTI